MSIILSRSGVKTDWGMDLPFNNHVAIRFQVNTGLEGAEHAFDLTENTHLWLLFHAAALLENESQAGQHIHRLIQPWHTVLDDDFHDALLRALWDADKRAPYNDPAFDLIPTWKSHFYDPDTGTNWVGQPSPTALSQGCRYYHHSLPAYQEADWEKAGYALGLALHYLSDLTQPMHAANFTWFDSQGFGYHTDFERYVKRRLFRLSPPRVYNPILSETTPEAYFHAVARHSKDTYYARIVKPEWTRDYGATTSHNWVWETRVGAIVPAILHDAVQITAQFLLMWFNAASTGK